MKNRCEHFELLCEEYVAGTLSAKDEAELTAHLKSCNACASHLAFTRSLSRMIRLMPDPVPPADFEARVLSRFRVYDVSEATVRRSWWRPILALGSASIGAGVFCSILLLFTPVSVLAGWGQELYYRHLSWSGAEPVIRAFAERLLKYIGVASGAFSAITRPLENLLTEPVLGQLLIGFCAVFVVSVLVARLLVGGFGGARLTHADS